MHTRGFRDRRGATGAGLAIAVLVVIALATGLVMALKREDSPPAETAGVGLQVTIAVEPFEVGTQVQSAWNAALFADSLAERLSRVRGIQAVASSKEGQFVLHGNVSVNEGRLVVATRLARAGARDTLWTATFWRSAESSNTVLTDLAQAVAEAVFSQSAKESLSKRRVKQ